MRSLFHTFLLTSLLAAPVLACDVLRPIDITSESAKILKTSIDHFTIEDNDQKTSSQQEIFENAIEPTDDEVTPYFSSRSDLKKWRESQEKHEDYIYPRGKKADRGGGTSGG